ncbi:spore coat polysaccharide biosynthesis protein SpsF [Halpernia humi]|uniref:Spore coat polysaccharide biosynthesis protein SpsF n=1 Tax=Halpernia humi TaxID=493375 RepID=A0A1H6A3B2_9FLAO|nr:3-deoxy-manno-octulosonate cytidylyltransferase [Halpernia humi]SEG42852.1 spore coat polysaccharide biosynthesis protein SpsF [Halpernia humi]
MKIGLLITARLKSSRLPFKLLKDLNGFTIIEHVINRSKKIDNVEGVILCTSTNPQDKPLADVALKNKIHYYLGSEDDVLQRLADASDFFSFDYILSITGENPLFSIDYANQIVSKLKKDADDFVVAEGLPIGCGVYGLSVKALKTVCAFKKEVDTEIWGPLINRPELFKVAKIKVDNFFVRPNLRLTNDYPEDFQMMNKIFNHFPYQSTPSLLNALNFLDENPEVLKINSEKVQAALSPETIERINTFFIENDEKIKEIKHKIYKQ